MINFPSSILQPALTHQHQPNTSKYSEWLNAFPSPGILQDQNGIGEGKINKYSVKRVEWIVFCPPPRRL